MTNTIACIEKADTILITGSNTSENHPVLSSFVKRAVTQRGAKLIVVDPRRIKIARFADLYMRQNLGSDVAWLNGMMHVIIKEGLHDPDFVEQRTNGFEEVKQTVEKFTPEYVEEITGIPAEDIVTAARMYATAERGSILYCMGITQHTHGTDNVKSLANLAMLCGNLGIDGGGVNPLRGQNNVQGACDMGGLPDVYSGYQKVIDEAAREKMAAAWEVDNLPDKPGMKVTAMVPAAHEGTLKSMYIIGENPLVSDPDLNHCEKSLKNLDFMVVQDIFLTETAQLADVVLPSCCFAEKDGTFANTERRVQRVRKAVDAPGDARDDWWIISEIATRMGYEQKYTSSEEIFNELASVTPSYGGITYERIEDVGLHWPCPNPDHPGTPVLHKAQFTAGKGTFHAIDYIPPAEQTDKEYPMYLTTGRLLYHYHTGTMTMRTVGLNEIAPECFVEMSQEDAWKYEVSDGAGIKISSRRGTIDAIVKISNKATSGTVFIPFHYAKAAANRLTNAELDPISGIPEFKVCAVKLEKNG